MISFRISDPADFYSGLGIKDLTSVADTDNFDADPDPTSEKNRIRIMLYVKFCNKKFLLKNGL
jgi:hypothetical protein